MPIWASPADDLYNKGVDALTRNQFDDAAAAFTQLIKDYPTGMHTDDARVAAANAYLQAQKYDQVVAVLAPLLSDVNKASYKGTALYFTALAHFSAAQAATDKARAKSEFGAAVTAFTGLIEVCTKTPTADNKPLLEPAYFYRALAEYSREDFTTAETDLQAVIRLFPASLSLPDYYVYLGSVYLAETNAAITAKQPNEAVLALAQKAIDAFDHVSRDPNALVQANEANKNKAEALYMIAQLDGENKAGYEKALDAYRLIRRRDDLVPLQEQHLAQLRAQVQDAIRANPGASSQYSMLIQREQGRLEDLKNPKTADPIILALIRMAECYIAMQSPDNADNARTILHRLGKITLPAEQQQEVDFQTLYSYVLGGQTAKAESALNDYLAKHGTDPNASSISYQIAAELYKRKDYDGALASIKRSLRDFPPGKGKYADDALVLEAQILTSKGDIAGSKKIVDDFLRANPGSPKAISLLMTRAQNEENTGDLAAALNDYKTVKDNSAAKDDLRSFGAAGYIKVLHTQKKADEVIAAAREFQAKFPTSTALPGVMLFSALSLSEKNDPGAVAALQEVAKKFPDDKDIGSFALFTVVSIYHNQKNVPGMIQAASDLRKAYPEAYPFLFAAADMASEASVKARKFDDAVALYQPLTTVSKPDIAAAASNKIGDIWYGSAKDLHFQSLPLPNTGHTGADRAEAQKRFDAAEAAYVNTLANYPDQLQSIGGAFEGMANLAKLRRSWGQAKDAELEAYLDKALAKVTAADMAPRSEMAKAGLVFIQKNATAQYPAALERYKKVLAANPTLLLTRQEADQLGELSLAAKDYATAEKVYTDLLNNASAADPTVAGYAYFGLGATALAQNNFPKAKEWFAKLKAMPAGGRWHPKIMQADYGVARADELTGSANDLAEAKTIYGSLMQAPQAGVIVQAEAFLGYGRILEKAGFGTTPTTPGTKETAVFYYTEPNLLYGPAAPAQSAEGLYRAGEIYKKAGDAANAKIQFDALKAYEATAPDWAKKAQ